MKKKRYKGEGKRSADRLGGPSKAGAKGGSKGCEQRRGESGAGRAEAPD